jgi:hypothetical protein
MKHYYFTETTRMGLHNLLDWFISYDICNSNVFHFVCGKKVNSRTIIDYIKYIRKYTMYNEEDKKTLNDIRKIYIRKHAIYEK